MRSGVMMSSSSPAAAAGRFLYRRMHLLSRTAPTASAAAAATTTRTLRATTAITTTTTGAVTLSTSRAATATAAAGFATKAGAAAAAAGADAPSSGRGGSNATDVYDLAQSIRLVKAMSNRAFDSTVNMNIQLNVDPRKPNQMVRGLAQLPFGSGKTTIVAVFARGERAAEAKLAGADIVGDQDLADKILAGTVEFSRCIATPDMMPVVSKVARILGPKGLMPNPKTGTVTHAVAAAVRSAKAGQVEFKSEKDGSVKASVGKVSFTAEALSANLSAFVTAVLDAKPSGAKGHYLKRAFLHGAMTASVEMDTRAPPFRSSSLASAILANTTATATASAAASASAPKAAAAAAAATKV